MANQEKKFEVRDLCEQLLTTVQKIKKGKRINANFWCADAPAKYFVTEKSAFLQVPRLWGLSRFDTVLKEGLDEFQIDQYITRHKRYRTEAEAMESAIEEVHEIYSKTKRTYMQNLFGGMSNGTGEIVPSLSADTIMAEYSCRFTDNPDIRDALNGLQCFCANNCETEQLLWELMSLLANMKSELLLRFQTKIHGNYKYYQIPEVSTYTERICVEDIDECTDFIFDFYDPRAEDAANRYRFKNERLIRKEMQAFLDRRANAYARAAYRLYHRYCDEIEEAVVKLCEKIRAANECVGEEVLACNEARSFVLENESELDCLLNEEW